MQKFQLWAIDTPYKKIELPRPRLASWNANSDPAKIALQRYLDDIEQELDLQLQSAELFLHMEIDVEKQEHLLHHRDLDNYLYPVVQRFRAHSFRFVSAIKRVGGGSYLQVGQAKPENSLLEMSGWESFQHDTGNVSVQKPEWKSGIRNALTSQRLHPLKPGAVELQIVWKCSSRRNWASLWKPTIDAMGPVLGETDPHRPFHPDDDRIISLALHLNTDDSLGWPVQIGMMWRSLSTGLQ